MTYRKKDFKYTIVFDFDGVINPYRGHRDGYDLIEAPVEGIREVIEALRRSYQVVVMSARAGTVKGQAQILDYLAEHGIVVDNVTSTKPPALVYIDDRGLKFEGTTKGLLEQIYTFTTWWEKEKETTGNA